MPGLHLETYHGVMATSVTDLKSITMVERLDESSKKLWPSEHTSTDFMGTEFIWQERKDVSVWYGITGYFSVHATGAFLNYNDKQ